MTDLLQVPNQPRAERVVRRTGQLGGLVGALAKDVLDHEHPAPGLHQLPAEGEEGDAVQAVLVGRTQRHGLEEARQQQEVGSQPLEGFADRVGVEGERRGEVGASPGGLARELAGGDRRAGLGPVEPVVDGIGSRGQRQRGPVAGPAAELHDPRP